MIFKFKINLQESKEGSSETFVWKICRQCPPQFDFAVALTEVVFDDY